jgi:hypothetical protein
LQNNEQRWAPLTSLWQIFSIREICPPPHPLLAPAKVSYLFCILFSNVKKVLDRGHIFYYFLGYKQHLIMLFLSSFDCNFFFLSTKLILDFVHLQNKELYSIKVVHKEHFSNRMFKISQFFLWLLERLRWCPAISRFISQYTVPKGLIIFVKWYRAMWEDLVPSLQWTISWYGNKSSMFFSRNCSSPLWQWYCVSVYTQLTFMHECQLALPFFYRYRMVGEEGYKL